MTPAAIDRVFGHGRVQMVTGNHVEVFREQAQPGERRRYTKRFLATDAGDFRQWTEREWRILARLVGHGVASVPEVARFECGVAGRPALVQTYDAGITVDHWATLLPVGRDGVVWRHLFHDCAHWWMLARQSLVALDVIHALSLVHLDLKADNVCIPLDPPGFDPHRIGERLRPRFDQLALIDFAFSLVSGERLTCSLPIARHSEFAYQSPRLLHALEEGTRGNLLPTRQLDWRCDFFSLAAMLGRYLPGPDSRPVSAWPEGRLAEARAFVARLQDGHDGELPVERPHEALIAAADAVLADDALGDSLRQGFELAPHGEAIGESSPTPVTRIAPPVPAGAAEPIFALDADEVEAQAPAWMRQKRRSPHRTRGLVLMAAAAVVAVAAVGTPWWYGRVAPAIGGTTIAASTIGDPLPARRPRETAIETPPAPASTTLEPPAPIAVTAEPPARVAVAPQAAAQVFATSEAPAPVVATFEPPTPAVAKSELATPAAAKLEAPVPARLTAPEPLPTSPPKPAAAQRPRVVIAAQPPDRKPLPVSARGGPNRREAPVAAARPVLESRALAKSGTRTPPPAIAVKARPGSAPILAARPMAAAPNTIAKAMAAAAPNMIAKSMAAAAPNMIAKAMPAPAALTAPAARVLPPASEAAPGTATLRPAPFPATPPADPEPPPIDYAQRAGHLLASEIPRSAQRAERLVLRVLFVASNADDDDENDGIRQAARAIRLAPADPTLAGGSSVSQARALHDAARAALLRRGSLQEAVALQTRAFGANPLDAEIAGTFAALKLRQHPANADSARQLALHALTLHDWKHPQGRIEDWTTLAVASALAGRERESRNAWLVALAIADSGERACRAAVNAYSAYGERLRAPVEAMLQRAHASGRRSPLCEWPPYWTTAGRRE